MFWNNEVHNLDIRVSGTKNSSLCADTAIISPSTALIPCESFYWDHRIINRTANKMKMRLKTEKSEIMGNQNEKRYIPPEDNTTGGSSSSVSNSFIDNW